MWETFGSYWNNGISSQIHESDKFGEWEWRKRHRIVEACTQACWPRPTLWRGSWPYHLHGHSSIDDSWYPTPSRRLQSSYLLGDGGLYVESGVRRWDNKDDVTVRLDVVDSNFQRIDRILLLQSTQLAEYKRPVLEVAFIIMNSNHDIIAEFVKILQQTFMSSMEQIETTNRINFHSTNTKGLVQSLLNERRAEFFIPGTWTYNPQPWPAVCKYRCRNYRHSRSSRATWTCGPCSQGSSCRASWRSSCKRYSSLERTRARFPEWWVSDTSLSNLISSSRSEVIFLVYWKRTEFFSSRPITQHRKHSVPFNSFSSRTNYWIAKYTDHHTSLAQSLSMDSIFWWHQTDLSVKKRSKFSYVTHHHKQGRKTAATPSLLFCTYLFDVELHHKGINNDLMVKIIQKSKLDDLFQILVVEVVHGPLAHLVLSKSFAKLHGSQIEIWVLRQETNSRQKIWRTRNCVSIVFGILFSFLWTTLRVLLAPHDRSMGVEYGSRIKMRGQSLYPSEFVQQLLPFS